MFENICRLRRCRWSCFRWACSKETKESTDWEKVYEGYEWGKTYNINLNIWLYVRELSVSTIIAFLSWWPKCKVKFYSFFLLCLHFIVNELEVEKYIIPNSFSVFSTPSTTPKVPWMISLVNLHKSMHWGCGGLNCCRKFVWSLDSFLSFPQFPVHYKWIIFPPFWNSWNMMKRTRIANKGRYCEFSNHDLSITCLV